MEMVKRVSALWAIAVVLTSGAAGADGGACKTFDPTPACCPHPPAQCCSPALAAPVEEADVVQTCGAPPSKGQGAAFNVCKRYFDRGDVIGEVTFGQEAGDVAAFDKLRTSLTSGRARLEPASISGATKAFVVRQLDDTGRPSRVSVWALVGAQIVHLEADRNVCDESQVLRLMNRALERLRVAERFASSRRPG